MAARVLNDAGYTVRATDHRGHGASIAGTPGDFGAPGFEALIADLAAYGASVGDDLPLFLFAHSMGSFAAQSVILTHSEQYAGVVLSGSTALDMLAAGMAQAEGPVGLEAFNAGCPTCRCWSSPAPTTRWPVADSSWRCSASATGTPGWST